jgi:hypothetical protein
MAKKKPQRSVRGRKQGRRRSSSRKLASKAKRSAVSKRQRGVKKAARPSRSAKTKARKPAKSAKKAAPRAARKTTQARPAAAMPTPRVPRPARTTTRRAPNLDRERRTVTEDVVPSPPSSLNLDRSASAARSGRAELNQRFREHTSTGPAMTAGDIDADWESAEAIGDEAPGGDNPTPDQDVVDEIGKALGVEYDDDEELQGGDEIIERDRNRWELDPASSDDYDDRED